jgi:alpha-galactosidase
LTANEYVSADARQAVLFAFLHSQQFLWSAPTLYLRGLDENMLYRIRTIDDKMIEEQRVLSGSFLMHHGLNFTLNGGYDSTSVTLERQ